MKLYVFEGHSDDTFGEYEEFLDDYDNCANGEPIQWSLLNRNGAGVIVTGCYCSPLNKGGGWMIGVEIADEEMPLVGWEFRLDPNNGDYRNKLEIRTDEEVTLRCLNRTED